MTPQTPQGALSDADIDELLLAHRMMDQWPTQIQIHGFARDIEAHACAADRLTAEQGGADFETWAKTILGDNPNWRESGECELARQAWRAALTTQPQAEPPNDRVLDLIDELRSGYVVDDTPAPPTRRESEAADVLTALLRATWPTVPPAPTPKEPTP